MREGGEEAGAKEGCTGECGEVGVGLEIFGLFDGGGGVHFGFVKGGFGGGSGRGGRGRRGLQRGCGWRKSNIYVHSQVSLRIQLVTE